MTQEQFSEYVERFQELQIECVNDYGIICALSVSATQCRVVIYTKLAPTQSYFLYRDADNREGEKVLSRIRHFIRSIVSWEDLNLDRGNG